MGSDSIASFPEPSHKVDHGESKEDGAGLIEWLKDISLEDLEAFEIPPIIPGVNDIMLDEVINEVDGQAKKSHVRASRGLRGAAEIASAASAALANINKQMRMKEGMESMIYSRECFTGAVLIPRDVEYFEARKTKALVLAIAQAEAEATARIKWTPLIPVDGVDPAIGVARMEAIAHMVQQADFLSRTLLQKKGHNHVGQVVNHEAFKMKMPVTKKKLSIPSGSSSGDAAPQLKVLITSEGSGGGSSQLKRSLTSGALPVKGKKAKSALDGLTRVGKQDLFAKIDPERRMIAQNAVRTLLIEDENGAGDVVSLPLETIDDEIIIPLPCPYDDNLSPLSRSSDCQPQNASSGFRIDLTTEATTIFPSSRGGTRTRRGVEKSLPVVCCCGCGLMTDSVQPCPHCSNHANGPIRAECLTNYRTCRACPNTKFAGLVPKFIFNEEGTGEKRATVASADISDAHRLLEPSKEDQAKFSKLVLSSLPMPLRGLTKSQCIALMHSYGSAEEKAANPVSSTTLLEETLDDSEFEISTHVKLKDLRTLRYLTTSSQSVLSWWLCDAVVNDYMALINTKALELGCKAHCFNSFFLPTYRDSGHKHVKRWGISFCKQHRVKSIFEMERLVVPLNLNNEHWTFILVDMRRKAILYCDSIVGFRLDQANESMQLIHRSFLLLFESHLPFHLHMIRSSPLSPLAYLTLTGISRWKPLTAQSCRLKKSQVRQTGR